MMLTYAEHTPELGADVFVAENATVLGQVCLGDAASVWYGCVLRGDVGRIRVGARSNIQGGSVIHVSGGALGQEFDTEIGADVTVGHRALLHGCRIADHVLIGMGATVMDGAEVGAFAFVAAGAVVPPGMQVPPGSLVMGAPARVKRPVRDAERATILGSAPHYVALAARHRVQARRLGP